MKKLNPIVLLVLFVSLPLTAQVGKKGSTKTTIIAGENIAIVQTVSGKVRGYIHDGTYIDKGIPYAKTARFILPVKTDAWKGVRSSLAWGPTCPMMIPPTVRSDEVSNAWINFARHGDPNHGGIPEWKPYSSENGYTMFLIIPVQYCITMTKNF